LSFTLSANGKAGRSGYLELGRSAIEILVRGLSALYQLELPGSERFGNTTLDVSQIEGGVTPNVIAQNASATVLVRVASDDLDEIKTRIEKTVSAASLWLDVNFLSPGIGPVHIDSDVKGTYLLIVIVRMHWLWFAGFETVVVNYGTDIPSLKGSHKRYLYGPGSILLAHSAKEHVSVADLSVAIDGYQDLITQALSRQVT
jgi:acetylornithine deacetylase